MAGAVDDLDPTGTLALSEEVLLARRAAEVEDLRLAAHWADLHAADPLNGPGGRRAFGREETDWSRWAVRAPRGCRSCACRAGDGPAGAPAARGRWWPTSSTCGTGCPGPGRWSELQGRRVGGPQGRAPDSRAERRRGHIVDPAVADASPASRPAGCWTLAEAKVIEADRAAHAARGRGRAAAPFRRACPDQRARAAARDRPGRGRRRRLDRRDRRPGRRPARVPSRPAPRPPADDA